MTNFAVRAQHHPLMLAHQLHWERQYQDLLREFLSTHKQFDGSAVAAWMRTKGLGDPDHHNHWGAQITYYANLGWFKAIGHGIPSGAGHTQTVRIWERTNAWKR